jgi:pimeloyl-ACP methyl ester carboxylesterase
MTAKQRRTAVPGREPGPAVRARMLAGAPVTEQRLQLAHVSTAVLEAGDGDPVVLLHGQGGFGAQWMLVLPQLAASHRVIAPDLPGLGASVMLDREPDAATVMTWLGELIERTCERPPALVGLSLGGAIAARYARDHPERLSSLVLVDSGGLGGRPQLRALLTLVRHSARPSQRTAARLRALVMVHPARAAQRMGDRWGPFEEYMLELARTPSVQRANRRLLRELSIAPIAPADLARISVPTRLIWGRHDRVFPLRRAEDAAERYGWPLDVIDDAGHVVFADQPEATLAALRAAISDGKEQARGTTEV